MEEETGEKKNINLVWIIVPVIIIALGLLIFFLWPSSQDQPSAGTSVSGIKILDKSFKLDSSGSPMAILLLAEVGEGSYCKLSYSNSVTGVGVAPENGEVSLTASLDNRLDLNLWGICCSESSDFTTKTGATCQNE